MAIELDGKTIETTPTGYLVDIADWSEDLAKRIAGLPESRRKGGY